MPLNCELSSQLACFQFNAMGMSARTVGEYDGKLNWITFTRRLHCPLTTVMSRVGWHFYAVKYLELGN